MNQKNITAGLILTLLGAILLLRNFDLLNINWSVIIKFWPLLLIYAGLSILYTHKKGWLVPLAMLLITITSVLLYILFKEQSFMML
ncbi:MAG: DUF5668 domain-containing protein [Bacteroidota bacterium]|jgi:hypothetical protein|nr:DUF5668 domain-containing protein [Bacteroidota bacterium]